MEQHNISEFRTMPIEQIWAEYDPNHAGNENSTVYYLGDFWDGIWVINEQDYWWAEMREDTEVAADGVGDSPEAALAEMYRDYARWSN